MFTCTWLRAPRDLPLAPRLYQRTYGRTYGRRRAEADQPLALPQTLRLTEMLKVFAADHAETANSHDIGRAA